MQGMNAAHKEYHTRDRVIQPNMVRRTHENVLAEMLEKVLAYNISQIIPVRKKLSEPEETERAAA